MSYQLPAEAQQIVKDAGVEIYHRTHSVVRDKDKNIVQGEATKFIVRDMATGGEMFSHIEEGSSAAIEMRGAMACVNALPTLEKPMGYSELATENKDLKDQVTELLEKMKAGTATIPVENHGQRCKRLRGLLNREGLSVPVTDECKANSKQWCEEAERLLEAKAAEAEAKPVEPVVGATPLAPAGTDPEGLDEVDDDVPDGMVQRVTRETARSAIGMKA